MLDIENLSYGQQLKAIFFCEQSDGYLKEWATEKIRELEKLASISILTNTNQP